MNVELDNPNLWFLSYHSPKDVLGLLLVRGLLRLQCLDLVGDAELMRLLDCHGSFDELAFRFRDGSRPLQKLRRHDLVPEVRGELRVSRQLEVESLELGTGQEREQPLRVLDEVVPVAILDSPAVGVHEQHLENGERVLVALFLEGLLHVLADTLGELDGQLGELPGVEVEGHLGVALLVVVDVIDVVEFDDVHCSFVPSGKRGDAKMKRDDIGVRFWLALSRSVHDFAAAPRGVRPGYH